MSTPNPTRSLGDRLQSLPKQTIYLLLIVFASVPLFLTIPVPNKPVESSVDFYANLMALKPGDRVLIGSDWTNSTRGESAGEMEALLRILMRRQIKFVVYSTGDSQAPQVARDLIASVAKEEGARTGKTYKPFYDYVVTGYFPSSEGTTLGINNNVLSAFAGRKEIPEGQPARDVRQSPVFAGIKSLSDFKYLVLVTASGTNTVTLERIKKAPMMFMVTGVMVPENTVYYQSGQLTGLCGGIKGVYDLETLMEDGINNGGPGNVESSKYEKVEGFKGLPNKGKGTAYYPTLHFCLLLLIVAVVAGNVGMFLTRRTKNGSVAK